MRPRRRRAAAGSVPSSGAVPSGSSPAGSRRAPGTSATPAPRRPPAATPAEHRALPRLAQHQLRAGPRGPRHARQARCRVPRRPCARAWPGWSAASRADLPGPRRLQRRRAGLRRRRPRLTRRDRRASRRQAGLRPWLRAARWAPLRTPTAAPSPARGPAPAPRHRPDPRTRRPPPAPAGRPAVPAVRTRSLAPPPTNRRRRRRHAAAHLDEGLDQIAQPLARVQVRDAATCGAAPHGGIDSAVKRATSAALPSTLDRPGGRP